MKYLCEWRVRVIQESYLTELHLRAKGKMEVEQVVTGLLSDV